MGKMEKVGGRQERFSRTDYHVKAAQDNFGEEE